MFKKLRWLASGLVALALAACSSTGYVVKTPITVPRTIRAPASIPPEVVPYVPQFVAALQAKGFTVGKTNDPRALDLVFEFNGNPFNLRVSAGLWRQGIPVLTGSSTNSGWGTVIARGNMVNHVAGRAIKQFRSELDAFAARAQIVPDDSKGREP
jgi:hypothetical protein